MVETGITAGQVFLTGTVHLSADSYTINIQVNTLYSHACTAIDFTLTIAQAFRVLGTDVTPRSGISTVTMTISITDINDNPPVILNPRTAPISLLEVGTRGWQLREALRDPGVAGGDRGSVV